MKLPSERVEVFVSTDKDARQSMRCVYLDVDNKRLLATDGHKAIRCEINIDEHDVSGPVPVEAFDLARKELKAIIKINGKDQLPDPWLKIECNADAIYIENLLTHTTHLVPRPKLGDSDKFPNVDAVMPTFVGKPAITLNRNYIAEISKNLDVMSPGLAFWVQSDEKVCGLATTGGRAVVALMPMRGDVELDEICKRATVGR